MSLHPRDRWSPTKRHEHPGADTRDSGGEPGPPARQARWALIGCHPFLAFVFFAYGISWTLWLTSYLGGGTVPFLLGVLGPMTAAGLVTWWSGGSLRGWLRPVLHWRVGVIWWAYAVGLPALLFGLVSLVLQVGGSPVDWGLAVDRFPSYVVGFVFVLLIGGAIEEPGWRTFTVRRFATRSPEQVNAVDRLQQVRRIHRVVPTAHPFALRGCGPGRPRPWT